MTTSGAFATTFTMSNTTSVTFPTSGTLATTSQLISTPVTVANGGTGVGTLTAHGVLIGEGTGNVSATTAGSAGQVLQSGGASADPTYSTPTYPSASGSSGKILISDGTNNIYSTPTYPNAASTALKHIKSDGTNFVTTTVTYPDASVTAGKVIVSDGTNYIASTPTFPNASATTGKIIISDGTNWIASTPTYPAAAGTSGNVLTSDGTNWTSSAAPGGGLITLTGNLTNSQIKNLHGTPITVISGQGSGKVIVIMNAYMRLIYGGTNVFTAGASQAIRWYYGTTLTAATTALNNAGIVAASSQFQFSGNSSSSPISFASLDNVSITLYNDVATEISGNAANNNTITWSLTYQVITI